MTRLSFVPVLLLLSGCSYAEPGKTFQVSSHFDKEQLAVMNSEADELCEASEGRYCASFTRSEQENKVVSRRISEAGTLGLTEIVQYWDEASTKITLASVLLSDRAKLRLVFRHELGHAGGCGCDEPLPKGNVMSTVFEEQPRTWTDLDLACVDAEY